MAGVRTLLKKTNIAEKDKSDEFARLIGRCGQRMCREEIGGMHRNTIIKIVEVLRNTKVNDFQALIRGDEKLSFENGNRRPNSFGPKSKQTFETILSYLRSKINPEEYGAKSIVEQVALELKEEIEKMAKGILRDRKIEDPEGSILADILGKLAEESRKKS